MTSERQRSEYQPPQPALDESYWTALLNEGEFSVVSDESDLDHEELTESQFTDDDSTFETDPHGPLDTDWVAIGAITQKDEVVPLKVIGYNRGGLLVEWRTLRGFVPASQLIDFPTAQNGFVRRSGLVDRVGQTLQLRVIELSPEKNRLILSERAAQAQPGERDNILLGLKSGDTIEGDITNLCDFGAFVDLGGLEGLIHISELSWGRVAHPTQLLERGQHVTAYVLDVDRSAGRIALSLKRLRPDPWKTVEERYAIGQIVEGIITNVVDFGAFACIEEGLEGLIHVSELAEGHFLHPRNVVDEGQTVQARILSINGDARRLGLSLRLQHTNGSTD